MPLFLAPLLLLALLARAQSAPSNAAPSNAAPSTAAPTAEAPLVQARDLKYVGAFRVPAGRFGESSFEFGGTAPAFCRDHHSLFIVGHDWDQAIAEIAIPEIRQGPLASLEAARLLQPFTKIAPRLPHYTLEDTVKIGGLLVEKSRLIGTVYEFYDADADAHDSHFVLDDLRLNSANVTGLFQVGTLGGGFVGGYMASVPGEWRGELAVSHLTGQAALPIISRTSAGPAIFGFDPKLLGDKTAPISPLLYYPLKSPLAKEDTRNPLFNTTTEIRGVAFPSGTRSILFFGSHGIGPWCYGTGDECGDPDRSSKGPHAAPYAYQVWAYDAEQLVQAKHQKREPWRLQPYAVWRFDFPYPERSKHLGGVAFDPSRRRLYVTQMLADESRPVVHVYEIVNPAGKH